MAEENSDDSEKERYGFLLDFMTPIVKAYCSEMGFRVCEIAIQCLGGYGYCKEYPLEQYLRDSKIFSIYEGTSGIQSLDLLGRKMRMKHGKAFDGFFDELDGFIEKNRGTRRFSEEMNLFHKALNQLRHISEAMVRKMSVDPLQAVSYSHALLRCYGDVIVSWRLLEMGIIAEKKLSNNKLSNTSGKKLFYEGKIFQATYFTNTVLPQTMAFLDTCIREGREIIEIPEDSF
jgi:hypothetical protein